MDSRRIELLALALMVTLMLATYPKAVFPATDTIGGTDYSQTTYPNYAVAFSITISGSGTVQSIGIDWAGTQSGNVRLALYSAGSGKPASVLTETGSTAMNTAAGWQDIAVTPYSVSPGTYWVAFQFSAEKRYHFNAGGSRSYYSKTYGAFDATWGGSSTQDSAVTAHMRLTYSTGPPPADFSISSTPTSQSVGAGGTASFTLDLAASGDFIETVSLGVTSGCPSGVTCEVSPTSISSFPGSATLSVPTLITTSGSYSVVVHAQSTSKSHDVTVTLSVSSPASYGFNVKSGATQIVVTLTYAWTGSGTPPAGSITIVGPGGTPVYGEASGAVYDRTSIAVSGSSSAYTVLHRVTFTVSGITSPQVWTALVSLASVSTYNITIEVS